MAGGVRACRGPPSCSHVVPGVGSHIAPPRLPGASAESAALVGVATRRSAEGRAGAHGSPRASPGRAGAWTEHGAPGPLPDALPFPALRACRPEQPGHPRTGGEDGYLQRGARPPRAVPLGRLLRALTAMGAGSGHKFYRRSALYRAPRELRWHGRPATPPFAQRFSNALCRQSRDPSSLSQTGRGRMAGLCV